MKRQKFSREYKLEAVKQVGIHPRDADLAGRMTTYDPQPIVGCTRVRSNLMVATMG